MRTNTIIVAAGAIATLTAAASASITGAVAVSYSVTAADFGGASVTVNVQDIYMTSNDAADTLLNVYNLTLSDTSAGLTYFQSFTGTGWLPTNLGGPFDTAALQSADSFVTIGGFDFANPLQTPGAGAGTGLDPNFGGNTIACPDALAGWYNGNPPSLNGQVGDTAAGLGVLVGRFAYAGDFSLIGSTLEVTWNQGLGTPGQQAGFTVVPAPGAIALLGLAGVAGRRRRHG
jgi:MYXO-CTERM domain-containing protein